MTHMTRRRFLEYGAAGGAALFVPWATRAQAGPMGGGIYIEAWPTSPLVLSPFTDPLPIPKALGPVPGSEWINWAMPPGRTTQDWAQGTSWGHQLWPGDADTPVSGYPLPIVYRTQLRVGTHSFTSSKVLAIDSSGKPTVSWDANKKKYAAGTLRTLPPSTIYGFSHWDPQQNQFVPTFPGPRINAEYGKPVLIRFENHLDENPLGLDRQDFGAPNRAFLTHLHNGHTACESDGNPHHSHWRFKDLLREMNRAAYEPGEWCDNLYLNYPAGGDDKEKQSFMWFHDHTHGHTGANVYKGMVGLYPIYDPDQAKDMGDETKGFRLPGVRTDNPDGSFDVDYDIPLAFYDCRLEDGVTPHKDYHTGTGETHPEWWGKTFFRHFPNHGFVGDVFTVNGKAHPVLEVKRRRYRLRFLDASISRIYEFKLMSSSRGPKAAKDLGYQDVELQGQYRLPEFGKGTYQCMRFIQIASEGGLLPKPIVRDSFELWPAKRREFVVDFAKYMDGSDTKKGDVIYLANIMKMTDGRMWNTSSRTSLDPKYVVPVLKIVIGDNAPDNSMPSANLVAANLRQVPDFVYGDWKKDLADAPVFELQRGSATGQPETEWLINGLPFDPEAPLAVVTKDSYHLWKLRNGGGGWVHPMHLHMEEHRVVMRNGTFAPDAGHPDDVGKEDVVALDPSEEVAICRRFRTFTGRYVAHCHNLAHEDHNMMFGWRIDPA